MKEYKLFWCEDIEDEEGFLLYISAREAVVMAENPKLAKETWSKKYNLSQIKPLEVEEIHCVVQHDIFKKAVVVTMPNTYTYTIPVEVIARMRSSLMVGDGDNNAVDKIAEHLKIDTIPLFVNDQMQILEWAKKIPWFDIENDRHVKKINKKITMNTLQDFWVNNHHKLEPVIK